MRDNQGKDISFEQSSQICLRKKSLSSGLRWAHYQNDHERIFYANNKQHTLSMYLSGGFETHRTDIRSDFGAPGRFCLMPKGCESHWQLGRPQQFMHLYFDDNYLKQLALKTFDIDPRMLSLPELTFVENSGLEAMFRHQMVNTDWLDTNNQMLMEQVTNTILVTMLQNLGAAKFTDKVKGGLAPKVLLQVCDFIHAFFHRQIFLSELAAVAQLSEYHFCRMFKENMAQTPQEYITAVRIKQVKLLISTTKLSLTDIALQCGFANQSHMGRCFKKIQGITPKQYRNYLLG
ncbi:helix-turn-helix transcriptional regulator [Psychromonas aquimarina]|uniref:helix-turn-helix transcriptional regulator n=1 Tax=Psychromonas aquimarina TaxID=444919 RepID=UPI000406F924|nr:AraC family transcriptional regulator [Psychromonas aquimarina]